MISTTRPCRMAPFAMHGQRPGSPAQPWVLLTADDGWEAACHIDDALKAAIYGTWRPGALYAVTDAMHVAARAGGDRADG